MNDRKSSQNKEGSNKKRPGKFRKQKKSFGASKKGRTSSIVDTSILIKKAQDEKETKYESPRTITDLPIRQALKESLLKKGFKKPTEIQDRTLEALIEGRDLLGIAQTGTGKTGAFLMPIIEQLLKERKKSFALIVVPTRELATQVEEEFKSMSKDLKLFSACFIGGTNINRDMHNLRRPSHIVIGTPGRLIDLVTRRALDLRLFNTLVLDEYDRMLDMGFLDDVNKIIRFMHRRAHTMLFSATMDKNQESLIAQILRDPVFVKVSEGDSSGDFIEQDVVKILPGQDKFDVLLAMLKSEEFQKVLVFEETKHKVSRLSDKLNKMGIKSDQIHGNKSQNARQRALNMFKNNEIQVLIATDVAARGIDVSDVTHVINYQLPLSYDSYIHRIGRTGRAGKRGKAFTFLE